MENRKAIVMQGHLIWCTKKSGYCFDFDTQGIIHVDEDQVRARELRLEQIMIRCCCNYGKYRKY
jgi:hypothetical protein